MSYFSVTCGWESGDGFLEFRVPLNHVYINRDRQQLSDNRTDE